MSSQCFRRGHFRRVLVGLALLLGLEAPAGDGPAATRAGGLGPVENFALLDQLGRFHELAAHGDRAALVLMVHGNGCPIARGSLPALRALREEFATRGVVFLLLNANLQDDRASVAAEAEGFGIDFPILIDETQLVAEALGVTRTAEVLLIDPRRWRVVYRGPVDDRLHYQTQRPARAHHLREALLAHLEGRAIEEPLREAPGCLVNLPAVGSGPGPPISYAEEIAPLLARRCRQCHRDGGVAPWAMRDYRMVRGWAPMMREMVRTRRMPPWHADRHVGRFADDLSLSVEEQQLLVHWIEAGAPRGEGPDPLAESPPAPAAEWPLGPPDHVVTVSTQRIPARGVVPYRYETVDVDLDQDVWIRAAHLQPSNPLVMHHGLAWIRYPRGHAAPAAQGPRFTEGMFAAYVPGREPRPLPDGTGVFLPAGSRIRFQLHYTATGRRERDRPRLGLYWSRDPAPSELKTGAVARFDFVIPAGARDHEERASLRLDRDILLYRLSPHMHYRGKWMTIEAALPDGRVEPLLSVPRYDFNWQRQYALAEPRRLPAGTRLLVRAGFDNSDRNPANPDPTVAVRYGEQSFEEMLFGYFLYRDLEPTLASGRRPD